MSNRPVDRRRFLGSVASVGAAALLPAPQAQRRAAPHRIDTHHHFTLEGEAGRTWLRESLGFMDTNGIASAVLSRPATSIESAEEARRTAREGNEFAAQVVRDHPTRYGFFATLPLIDVDGSLEEIEYAYETLKADGVVMMTSYAGKWPGDPSFAPVMDELNRRRAVAFVHPTVPVCCNQLEEPVGIDGTAMEYMFDHARVIASLILKGRLQQSPEIRWIIPHGGGAFPVLHQRLDYIMRVQPRTKDRHTPFVPNGVVAEMRKLYFDVVLNTNPAGFGLLQKLMPMDHLLFATDYPPLPIPYGIKQLPELGLDGKTVQRIERENALSLFPRFKASR